jgi:hypothetical protein
LPEPELGDLYVVDSSMSFPGGLRVVDIHGVAKPAYHAFHYSCHTPPATYPRDPKVAGSPRSAFAALPDLHGDGDVVEHYVFRQQAGDLEGAHQAEPDPLTRLRCGR